jgi:hypothetical protein
MTVAPALITLALAAVVTGARHQPPRDDMERNALPPAPPVRAKRPDALFSDNFQDGKLDGWTPDQSGVWSISHGMLRADLPDGRQLRSFIYAGSEAWGDIAVDLDVCGIRGVDKGVAVRVNGKQGVGVDLRGPGYQDLVVYRHDWPMGRASVVNANAVWHHIRVEARGHHYRVYVNGTLLIDREDPHKSYPTGRIALPAYTGGVGECTVYYDNVVVTPLP